MKIVLASGIYPPDIGGPATYSKLIAEEFRKKGHDVFVVCYGEGENRISRKNSKPIRYFLYFWKLFKLAKNADVIYAQGPLGAGLPAMWVKKILKKKFVIKIVGDYAWEQYENQKSKIKSQKYKFVDIETFQKDKYDFKTELRRKIQFIVTKKADKVIVPSEFLKKIVSGWGVNEDKIEVIYNSFSRPEKIKSVKLDGDIIISAGRSEPWKGMDTLKEIMPELKKENSKFKLIIATKLPHDELMGYFKTSKMFVLNSGYEGFSHILLEAMAMELPIITTNVCGNPEIIKDGYNGLLVEYNNKKQLKGAILKLWKDKELQKKFIENGKKTLERFKLERMVNETMNVLSLRNMPARGGSASGGKLLMITGDRALAQGKKGPFYYMLQELSCYWDRIDIICPSISTNPAVAGDQPIQPFNNVFIHPSNKPLILHPFFILKKGVEIYKEQKFDLFTVHSYPPFYNDIGGRWLGKKIKVPYMLEIMHITGYPKSGNSKERFYRLLTKLFTRYFAKKAKAVRIINQKQTKEFLLKAGINEKKLLYIPAFYIDLETFKPQNLDKEYNLVFSGRLVKNKGIFLLLKAVKHFNQASEASNQTSEAIKLMIIGDGPLKPKIEKYIKKHNLQKQIIFSGWLPTTKDVAKIYSQSKILIMPSFNEGGPRVCLEAMACKTPVITSKVGIMLDIIRNGENGMFIDWNVKDITEKINLLLGNKELYIKIAENGYKTIQQFERKKAIENYAKTYKNLLYNSRV